MTEYYKDFNKYVIRKRWMSYWHQVKEVLDTQPKSVLLIGIGNGIIPAILKEKGIQVYTFDNDESLSPDFCGDLRNIETILSGWRFDTILWGFRNKDLVILEEEFSAVSDKMVMMTDDGSYGTKGLVTNALKELLDAGEQYDEVIAIGPLIMMKFVAKLTKEYGVKTIVSMNPIMIDGTGMCGCCRVTVDGKIRFACVDGPDFDGHMVDFDELMHRNRFYKKQEAQEKDHVCQLFGGTENA